MKQYNAYFPAIGLFIGLASLNAYATEPRQLVYAYCYVLQASETCDNVDVKMDTEEKIEKQVGGKFREQKTPYSDECLAGMIKAVKDEGKGLCTTAWEKYGCHGSEIPRLLQENPFKNRNGVFCKY